MGNRERKTKEDFCDHQRGLGGSYMRTAVTTLALLLELVNDDDVAAAFLTPSLVCSKDHDGKFRCDIHDDIEIKMLTTKHGNIYNKADDSNRHNTEDSNNTNNINKDNDNDNNSTFGF